MATQDILVAEKVSQAIAIMNELDIDAWLTFAQEVGDGGDPTYPIIFGERDLGSDLLILTRQGGHIAIVGGLDMAIPPSTGVWDEVIVHGGDIKRVLLETLTRLEPRQIAINYSLRNVKADGLSYGKFLQLQQYLAGSPYLDRLISAQDIVTRLRARKSSTEVALIRAAIATTDEIFAALRTYLRAGMTGRDIYTFILNEVDRRGLRDFLEPRSLPGSHGGTGARDGHTPPGDVPLQRGWTLQVDLGVKQNGFCSDFQRMWYVLEAGETQGTAGTAAAVCHHQTRYYHYDRPAPPGGSHLAAGSDGEGDIGRCGLSGVQVQRGTSAWARGARRRPGVDETRRRTGRLLDRGR